MGAQVAIGLDAVIVAVVDAQPRVLTVTTPNGRDALPSGPLDAEHDATLELGLRRWIREQAGLEVGYVEQLYTFGDLHRVDRPGPRQVSVAYLGLVGDDVGSADWASVYDFFPWEDHRVGRPTLIDGAIAPQLVRWAGVDEERIERIQITFGLDDAPWDGVRVLERYELLYEAGLVAEADVAGSRDRAADLPPSRPMALDHRRITATALGRLRGKLTYRPVVFELLPERFTLLQLLHVVEALAGAALHKQNFRRLVERSGLVERTGVIESSGPGRPAELFRFRREVLRERRAPGVGILGPRR